MDQAEVALYAAEATKTGPVGDRFPGQPGCTPLAGPNVGWKWLRLVAHGREPFGTRSHERSVVQGTEPRQPHGEVSDVTTLRRTAGYEIRMSGGVGGRGA